VAKARYLVEAHLVEGRSVAELAAAHGVHRSWIYKLLARYRDGGYEALEPRSRAPRSNPHRTPGEVVEVVVSLREQLLSQGHDGGAETIAHHLARQGIDVPSVSTIWRILRREGLVTPQPQKRPRSSLIRFEAELPNEMWQADITHWQLAGGLDVEILSMIDDHSRLSLASRAFPTAKAADVVDVFRFAIDLHGAPASLLCDNGAVFTATPRGGKVLLQLEMERLGVAAKNSRPYHPQTCGKVERLHQTLKRYLAKQAPAKALSELQAQLDAFAHYYNAIRPLGPWEGARPCRPSAPGSRPGQSARLSPTPTSASATTRSIPWARSPCATTQGSTTSASVARTREGRSSSSSPIATSASSTPKPAS
jgi:transposase InsO family protein